MKYIHLVYVDYNESIYLLCSQNLHPPQQKFKRGGRLYADPGFVFILNTYSNRDPHELDR